MRKNDPQRRSSSTTHQDLPRGGHALPEFLKADEVAQLLRVDRKTIYEAARRGEVPGAIRIGRSLRFRRDAVLGWLST
jgi:excisionase family DNA binding protein